MSINQASGSKRGLPLFIPNSNNSSVGSIVTVSEPSVSSSDSKSKPRPAKRQHTNSGPGTTDENSVNNEPLTNSEPGTNDELGENPTLDDYIKHYKGNEIASKILTDFLPNKPEEPEAKGGSGRFYTIKYGLKRVDRSTHPKDTYNEIRALKILNANHCNCAPRLISVTQKGNKVYLLMSYTDGKTLDNWLETNPSEEQKAARKKELKEGLEKIHSFNIIHADIKPENIWIPDDPKIPAYFIDFGSAIKEGEEVVSTTRKDIALGTNTASKVKDTADLDILFPTVSGGGKTRRNHKHKKLNKSRRHHISHH